MSILEKAFRHMIFTPERIGAIGEEKVSSTLAWSNFFGIKGCQLRNVYIPRQKGGTTEIDLLYITRKGIYVIESKNYTGYIFGSETNSHWTSTLYAGKDFIGRKRVEKHTFYNPVWQNRTHMNYLQKYLNADIPMLSVIVFSDRCQLKSIDVTAEHVIICQQRDLPRVIRHTWQNSPDILTEEDVSAIYHCLLPLTDVDAAVKARHVEDIHRRFSENGLCPVCGGKLVLRTARQGANAGKQFWGCSNYPKCKYTKACCCSHGNNFSASHTWEDSE